MIIVYILGMARIFTIYPYRDIQQPNKVSLLVSIFTVYGIYGVYDTFCTRTN